MVAKKSAKAAKVSYAEPGHITLTPAGKKAITAARHSLAVATNASPSAVPEDLIWKHVTQAAPISRGLKRGRRSSIKPPPNPRELDSDHDATWSISAHRAKRPRTSTTTVGSSAKKPISRMNKAELQEELRALKKAHDDVLWLRASSPLTDLDEDDAGEINRLRRELRDREEEVERIRCELPGTQGDSRPGPQGPPTPEIDETLASPSRPAQPRPLNRITRAASGSRISLLSKQPTPAPSSPGAASEDLYLEHVHGHENDEFAMQEDHHYEASPSPFQQIPGTMMSATDSNGAGLPMLGVERDLRTRTAEINELKAQLSQLQTNYSKAQQGLVDRDHRLSVLSENITNLESAAKERDVQLDRHGAELVSLKAAKVDLELSYSSRLQGLREELWDRDTCIQALKEEQEKNLAQLSRLQESLNTTERSEAALASQVTDAEAQITKLRSELDQQQHASDLELQAQRSISTELEKKIQAFVARTSELDKRVDELQRSESATAASLADATAQQALISEQLRDAETRNEYLLGQLSSVSDARSTLEAALKVSEEAVARLTSQITALDDSLSQEKANVQKLAKSLAAAEQEGVTLRQQVATKEVSVSALRSELDLSRHSTAELTMQLAAVTSEKADISGRLDEAKTIITASASSMTQLKESLRTTTDQLRQSESAAAQIQANLDATVRELSAEKDRSQGLRDAAESKDLELHRLREQLSATETRVERLQAEAMAKETKIRELRSELADARDQVSAAQDSLTSANATHALESDKQASVISGLQNLLSGAQSQIEGLKSELESARSRSAELQALVDEQSAELGEATVKLDSERHRASRVEAELAAAIGRAQEVEEELSELKISKEADEATIENLKGMFSALRDTQMKSLAELDSKVVSTKSSPAPKRRSTRNAAAKAIPPFKLT
ncbi:hypothetical protein LshimejAT787_2001020 [Lyophyllum shimeji]|uniref:Uncharacterized protein n=1 Tax=Lyophyllum shimeji TaxID=47721 RepID=A0A9P3Q1Q2_LYOSH|nr:hypothetical protein LshimejAT787_2001020 [Lyophyllum shimeji]